MVEKQIRENYTVASCRHNGRRFNYGSSVYVFVGDDAGLNPYPDPLYVRSGSGVPGCKLAERTCVNEPIKRIGGGEYLVFSDADDAGHTVTSGTPESDPSGEFGGGPVPGLVTCTFAMSERGEHDWFCTIHPWTAGKIIVG